MSEKVKDDKNRWRNKIVAFRMSPEESEELDKRSIVLLKELEKDGLVKRYQYNEMPVRVDYSLTDKSLSLLPILLELKDWGAANL
jgi:hypothetical protein